MKEIFQLGDWVKKAKTISDLSKASPKNGEDLLRIYDQSERLRKELLKKLPDEEWTLLEQEMQILGDRVVNILSDPENNAPNTMSEFEVTRVVFDWMRLGSSVESQLSEYENESMKKLFDNIRMCTYAVYAIEKILSNADGSQN